MIQVIKQSFFKNSAKKYIKYIAALFVITIFHTALLDFIAIQEITPDLFIILVVWICLKEGTFFGLIAGFFIGIFFDVISADIVGTNALAKTIAAFITSFFYKEGNENKITKSYKFILIVLLVTFIHNIVYFFFYIKTSDQDFFLFYLKYGLASTVYTTFFSIFVFLFQIPSNRIKISSNYE